MTTEFPRSLTLAAAIVMLTGVVAASESFRVFKSVDRGRSWTRSDAGIPPESRINAFGSGKGALLAGTDRGVFVSRDEARRWEPGGGAAMASGRILAFATSGQRCFAGTDGNGLLVSSDGGRWWGSERSFPSLKVRCLLSVDDRVYAGTDADGVLASKDGGCSWNDLSAGLPRAAQVFAITAARGRIFAGLYSEGLYLWDERRGVWSKVGGVTPLALASVQDTLIAGHNPGGIQWSEDLGVSWSRGAATVPPADPMESLRLEGAGELASGAPVWDLRSGGDLVFAGASAGIYYTQNQGRTWTRARDGLPAVSPGIAFLVEGNLVLAATFTGQSRDGTREAGEPPAGTLLPTTTPSFFDPGPTSNVPK